MKASGKWNTLSNGDGWIYAPAPPPTASSPQRTQVQMNALDQGIHLSFIPFFCSFPFPSESPSSSFFLSQNLVYHHWATTSGSYFYLLALIFQTILCKEHLSCPRQGGGGREQLWNRDWDFVLISTPHLSTVHRQQEKGRTPPTSPEVRQICKAFIFWTKLDLGLKMPQ